MPLYWKVVIVNGGVFVAGTLALVLTPAQVSREPVASEGVVLGLGLAVMLLTNGLLLRASLAPVDRVVNEMGRVDPADPAEPRRRLAEPSSGPGAVLVRSFNVMVERLERERGASEARALAAQEAERQRVAHELHDEVGQSLTVVLLELKDLQSQVPQDLVERVALVRESARAGLDDVSRVARRLRPGVLADLGLHSALSALVTEFPGGRRVRTRRTIGIGLPTLDPNVELVVYRVAQEALTNVARHADASEVLLSLTKVGEAVVLEVADDGRGPAGLVAGAGVRGMRERAALVGGTLSIDSPGRGTRVRLRVPVP